MTNCTSDEQVTVHAGASLLMEDSLTLGSSSSDMGASCLGEMKTTRCTFENNEGSSGVHVMGAEASAELVDCVIRKNGYGVYVTGGKAVRPCCGEAPSARTWTASTQEVTAR